ncbi:hypothetical protein [Algivirga pacifica]|uniref:BioF2-like acetyltransferase domain-containing protein n=1 Tax=Algivirga pacifica TaxID=1162670 RepID=A0ABP9DCT4_9BACT
MNALQHVKRTGLNTKSWDNCIMNSQNPQHFALSWFLDAAGMEWEALVEIDEQTNEYLTVMPFQVTYAWGIKHIFQSPFCQQLGVFSTKKSFSTRDFQPYFDYLKDQKYVGKYFFHHANPIRTTRTMNTHILSLNSPYPTLKSVYSKGRKDALRKSINNGITIQKTNNYRHICDGYTRLIAERNEGYQDHVGKDLLNVIEAAYYHGILESFYAIDREKNIIGGMSFMVSKYKIDIYTSFTTAEGLKYGCTTLLMDHIIQKYANTNKTLDFCGSHIESINQFFQYFGAKKVQIPLLHVNNLPWWIKGIKWLKNKLIDELILQKKVLYS